MIPIFWRYMLRHYLKYFFYCVVTFLAVLITTRLNDIAHFATLGPEGKLVLLYTLYQIPYILPIAIPLSCLISATIVMQNLSKSHELTALRAAGLSTRSLATPLLIASLFLSLANFYITSELTTHSHLSMNMLKNDLRSINPLLLLHNRHLMRTKGFYFDTLGNSKMGETASDVIFATPNRDDSHINLLLAKKLEMAPNEFHGQNVTIFSSLGGTAKHPLDRLIIENIQEVSTSIADFAKTVEKKVWSLNNDYLRLPLLLVRLSEARRAVEENVSQLRPENIIKQCQKDLNRCYSEIFKRLSVGFAPFSFTLMGLSFGVSIGRGRSGRGILYVVVLAALYLVCFFAGKGGEHRLIISSLFYFGPHLLIGALSLWMMVRFTKGVE